MEGKIRLPLSGERVVLVGSVLTKWWWIVPQRERVEEVPATVEDWGFEGGGEAIEKKWMEEDVRFWIRRGRGRGGLGRCVHTTDDVVYEF